LTDSGANDERGSIDDLPWASVFDPAANARALSAIQAEGFRAASQIVDRFIRIVTPESAPDGVAASSEGSGPGARAVSDLETLTRSWWSTVGRMLLQSAPKAGAANRATSTFELSNAESAGAVTLEVEGCGTASAEVWLHNRGPNDLGVVALRCSALMSASGQLVASDAVEFEPDFVPMPARSSRGVVVNVDVPEGLAPGLYRGTLLVEGQAELWLPVVLAVDMPAP